MNPQYQQVPQGTPQQNSPMPYGPVNNPLSVMQENEQVICEIKRHPIGMYGIYFMVGFLLIVAAILVFAVAPNVLTNYSKNEVVGIGALVFMVIAAVSLGFTAISYKVYWANRWIVTSDSVTQISRTSLFDKQSSQLSLGNLEDVTAEQNGILTQMFHYGLLRMETAGERSKFTFMYCPNPTYYAQQILRAREDFEQHRRGEGGLQRPYREEGAYASPAPDQQPPAGPSTAIPQA